MPDADVVRRHFLEVLGSSDDRAAVLVLVDGPDVLGMVEVSLSDDPPEHQVLLPNGTARLHVVVAPTARGLGVGTALERAAAAWAVGRGARVLVAGIQADNHPALQFYGWVGYRDQAVVKVRELEDG